MISVRENTLSTKLQKNQPNQEKSLAESGKVKKAVPSEGTDSFHGGN
jgi:hypothetical protein